MALNERQPQRAIEILSATSSYEQLARTEMMTVYLRGQAYLAAHQGAQAAAEFQKILDRRAAIGPSPTTAFAQLGLARSYMDPGDTAKSRAAYLAFFNAWKDADPEVPVLKQARAEYAKLQ